MNRRIKQTINVLIASILSLMGYGCHSKKVVVVNNPDYEYNDLEKYGVPQNTEGEQIEIIEKDIEQPPVCMYGVPPIMDREVIVNDK